MKAILVLVSLFVSAALAKPHQHKAHVHGAGKLSIAFDQQQGQLDFETPAQAIVGFERVAQSAKDQKTVAEALAKFESQLSQSVQMDPELKCVFSKNKLAVEAEGHGHSEVVANFAIQCAKSPLGSHLKIDFSTYPKLKNLDVTVLVGELQKTAQFKGQALHIELKP